MSEDVKNLMLIPSVGFWKADNGSLLFDRKFHDGVLLYLNYWPGSIILLIAESTFALPAFGLIEVDINTFPLQVQTLKPYEQISFEHLQNADLVLASADDVSHLHIATLCLSSHKKCIYIIEYIHETRIQILNLSDISFWKKAKSFVWHYLKENTRIKAIKQSNGLQSNGLPALNAYGHLTPNSLLYFDTRITDDMLITEAALTSRLAFLDQNKPLRLTFSGRLIAMKGADHLITLANLLKQRGVLFRFDIFGDGNLLPMMKNRVEHYQLTERVFLHGAVDFATELLPFISNQVDLFVCCHRQSDPSCTYLETYSCGVPIIGYNNRAHQGILDIHDVGWSVKMNAINDLATKIEYLSQHREEIKQKAQTAIEFARNHTFENTFKNRMDHCLQVLNSNDLYSSVDLEVSTTPLSETLNQ